MAFKKVAVNYNLPKQIAEEIENKRYKISKNWNERWNNVNINLVEEQKIQFYIDNVKDENEAKNIKKLLQNFFIGITDFDYSSSGSRLTFSQEMSKGVLKEEEIKMNIDKMLEIIDEDFINKTK